MSIAHAFVCHWVCYKVTSTLQPKRNHAACKREMFYYLSFLRPPPLEAPPSVPISMTPQIANDLRTELSTEPQDIYYSWCTPPASQAKPNQIPIITKPQKLTTWKEGIAYKELMLSPPAPIPEGQLSCLVLITHAQGYPHVINLGSPDVGQRPHPVISMPILFTHRSSEVRGTAHAGKQEHIERIYRIPLHATEQVFMRIKEQTSFDLDKVRHGNSFQRPAHHI